MSESIVACGGGLRLVGSSPTTDAPQASQRVVRSSNRLLSHLRSWLPFGGRPRGHHGGRAAERDCKGYPVHQECAVRGGCPAAYPGKERRAGWGLGALLGGDTAPVLLLPPGTEHVQYAAVPSGADSPPRSPSCCRTSFPSTPVFRTWPAGCGTALAAYRAWCSTPCPSWMGPSTPVSAAEAIVPHCKAHWVPVSLQALCLAVGMCSTRTRC